jgi:hypothetical protein
MLGVVLLALDELEDVEAAHFAIGEKAVDGGLLIVKHFEDRGELGEDEKLGAALGDVKQLHGASGFFSSGVRDDQRAEAGAIDVMHVLEVHNEVGLAARDQGGDGAAEIGRIGACDEAAIEVEDQDAFHFPLAYVESHCAFYYSGKKVVPGAARRKLFPELQSSRQQPQPATHRPRAGRYGIQIGRPCKTWLGRCALKLNGGPHEQSVARI